MSASIALAPNILLLHPFLKSSSCAITHSYPLSADFNKPCFRTFSYSTQTTTTTTTSTKKPLPNYLTERLGFSEEDSQAISKKLLRRRDKSPARHVQATDLISIQNTDNVISYLKECGLNLSHIKKVISKYPLILTTDADKTFKPKITLLQDVGFSTSDLAHVLYANPGLYLEADLSPAIQALRGIMGSDKNVVKFFRRLRYGSAAHMKNVISNVTMLENEYGISRDKIIKFMTRTPQSLMGRTEWLRDVLVRIEDKWGISRNSGVFLTAVHVFCCIGDKNINLKCQVYKSFGWSESDVLSLMRKNPICFAYSQAKIKKFLEFNVKELGCEPRDMATKSCLLAYSLENRVVPRHRVLLILKEKGLIRADFQLYSAIIFSENAFLDRFINPFVNDVPNLHEVYKSSRGHQVRKNCGERRLRLKVKPLLLLKDGKLV